MGGSLSIAFRELRHKLGLLFLSSLFSAFIGFVLGHQFAAAIVSGQYETPVIFSLLYPMDFMLITLLPVFGTLSFSREYMSWSTITEEPFLKRLRFYRMWAIPLSVIVWSRMLYVLLCLAVGLTTFTALFVWGSWPALSGTVCPAGYVSFLIVMACYACALNGINPYLEYGVNGKAVLISAIFIVLVGLAVSCLFRLLLDKPLYVSVYQLADKAPLLTVGVGVVCAAASVIVLKQALHRRIRHKDLP